MKNLIAHRLNVHCSELAEQGGIEFAAIVDGIQAARERGLKGGHTWIAAAIPLLTPSDMAKADRKAMAQDGLFLTFCEAVAACYQTLDGDNQEAQIVALESVVAMKLAFLNAKGSTARQRINASKRKGVKRERVLTTAKLAEAKRMVANGKTKKSVAEHFGVSPQALGKALSKT